MTPPWTPDDQRWGWLLLAVCVLLSLVLMFGGAVFGQPGDPRPTTQTVPIMTIDSQGRLVVVGDLANHALRVNVVSGSSGGPSGTIGAAFPSNVAPAGARDASGFLASFTVTNAGRLNVTCDNCSSSAATFAAAFPTNGGAIGFKDGGGMMASATVDNAGNQFVIASQGSTNWTVTATGTITAHQGDTWNIRDSNGNIINGVTETGWGAAMPASGQASGFRSASGFFASASVTNNNALLVEAVIPSTGDVAVKPGDTVNNAIRVNIVAGAGSGGTASSYAAAFPALGTAAGFKDGGGKMASASVDNAGNLFVIASQGATNWTVTATGTISAHQADTWTVSCSNCSGSSTTNYAAAFPAAGLAIGVKDGAGRFASMAVDNASNLFVIASQSSSAWTVTATGTVTAHQGDNWVIRDSNGNIINGVTETGYGATAPATGQGVGFRNGSGFFASASVTNNNALLVETVVPSTTDVAVKPGDSVNNAIRVNVVAGGAAGGTSSNFDAAFPAAGTAAGFRDGGGHMHYASVDNAGNQFVIASQSATAWTQKIQSGGSTDLASVTAANAIMVNLRDSTGAELNGITDGAYNAAFPARGLPMGFRTAGGLMASASMTNNNAILVETVVAGLTDALIKPGDAINNAMRVNVVAGSAGGPSGTIGAAFPNSVAPAGVKDAGGFLASLTVTNAGRLNVTCDNCGGGSTFANAFPSTGVAIGFRDGAGFLASASVDNAGNQFVIASQGSTNWTVTATGTITAHQGDVWTVGTNTWLGSTAPTVGQKTMANSLPITIASDQTALSVTASTKIAVAYPGTSFAAGFKDGAGFLASGTVDNAGNLFVIASQSASAWTVTANGSAATTAQASGNPVRVSGVAQTTGRALTDGQVGDLSLTTTSDLRVHDDTSAATGTLAPARVQMQGGIGKNGVATAVTVCDQFATVTMGWQTGNQQVITGPATGQIHICSIMLIAASATSVSVFEGSGVLCNTNRTPIFGSAATINGLNLATTGGFTMGTGVGDIAQGQYTGSNICIGNSTSAVVTGGIKWTSY